MLNGERFEFIWADPGTQAEAGLVAECVFLLETVCPDSLGADRFWHRYRSKQLLIIPVITLEKNLMTRG